ncbi:hypothetical protein BJ085DRAFT_37628 [Dimargaris cristalligena]|uniref:Cell division control protein 24 OB domain-containing protein n=1 Tax=Dimargaris cristalligena TaxID=215637 RepID=A0A4Q0A2X8_9FUNG|nr:hypothetical protein BJ085DRAFT_37628 [Dimargaris cristalligena]|eukprot:RKP40198.1 hypothetical protein BJ085DRAFT_37628 [Dimargaris cristalligena]
MGMGSGSTDFVTVVDGFANEISGKGPLAAALSSRSPNTSFDLTDQAAGPPWGWLATTLLDILDEYPSGLTFAIIVAELNSRWSESKDNLEADASKKFTAMAALIDGHSTSQSLFEMSVVDAHLLPNTQVWFLRLQETDSAHSVIQAYLHQKFYVLTTAAGFHLLTRWLPRRIRFTGARVVQNADQLYRLLPTPWVVFELHPEVLNCRALKNRRPGLVSQSLATPPLATRVIPLLPPGIGATTTTEHLDQSQTQAQTQSQTDADSQFVKNYFASDFLSEVTPEAIARGQEFRFLVKIIHIIMNDATQRDGHRKKAQLIVTDYLDHDSTADPWDQANAVAALTLWDDQIPLALAVKRGDCLGIYLPTIINQRLTSALAPSASFPASGSTNQTDNNNNSSSSSAGHPDDILQLEYGPQTILFHIPPNHPSAVPSQRSLKTLATGAFGGGTTPRALQDDLGGMVDCKYFPTRIKIGDLVPLMNGVTLVAQVVAVSQNLATGFADSDNEEFQVSHCRVVITGWRPCDQVQTSDYVHPSNDHLGLVVLVHNKCQRSVMESDAGRYYCTFCQAYVADDLASIGMQIRVIWQIDDGTGMLELETEPSASKDIIGVSAAELSSYRIYKQNHVLNSTIGKSFYISVIRTPPGQKKTPQTPPYLITAACPPDGIMADTRTLCSYLVKKSNPRPTLQDIRFPTV